MDKQLHIVSFDVPYPPTYGGVIDVYYKIEALKALGYDIFLHCFYKDRLPSAVLNEMCEEVYYYKKRNYFWKLFSQTPFVTLSRNHRKLMKHLRKAKAPILFEGLKTTACLPKLKGHNHPILVRTHNIEHHYFYGLSQSEPSFIKRQIFRWEAGKMKWYEAVLKDATELLTLSPADQQYFDEKFNGKAVYLPVFHGNSQVKKLTKRGQYCMYHGDLRVADNQRAVHFLIDIFSQIDLPFKIVAGRAVPSIVKRIQPYKHIEFVSLAHDEGVEAWIENAQLTVLPTFQKTGIKLKLINSLFNGRFCLVTPKMVQDTGLDPLCEVAEDKASFKEKILELYERDYTQEIYALRVKQLALFDNSANAKKLIEGLTYTTS